MQRNGTHPQLRRGDASPSRRLGAFIAPHTPTLLANNTTGYPIGFPQAIQRRGAGIDTMCGSHTAPFPPAAAMVGEVGDIGLGTTDVVSTVRTLIIT